MIRKAFRSIISISRWSLIALSIFPISTAHADSNPLITEPTDFWFSFNEPIQFLAQTYQSDAFPSDPQLWLYNNDTGEEVASNDDYIGLQSKIDLEIPAGNYRLRAGTCCGDPNAWRDGVEWNIQYELSFNGSQSNTTTTSTTTSTTTTTIPTGDISGGGCGPYHPMYVTGQTGGSIWGSGPFTDDSNFGTAAVFLGLIQPGESAWVEPYWVDNYSNYEGKTQNNVSTSSWNSNWCGYYIKLTGTPTPETTTTTWAPTTTSTTSTTTSTTTAPTTTVPVTEVPTTEATTTTEPTTTTTTSTTSLPLLETTSTTVADTVAPSTMPTTSPSVTTVEPPQTSLTPTTTLSPFFPTPLTTLPNTTTTSLAPTTTVTTSTPPTEPPTTTTEPPSVVIPDNPTPEEVNQLADELVSSITELSDEEITNLVNSIEVSALTEESISAIFSEEVLNELSDDQVTELIDAIVPGALSDEQGLALSEALTSAPDNVKQEFEQQVDVFGGKFDTYVPTGSAVSVGARRVLVAAAAASFAMPTPSSSSRKQK